MQLPLIFNLQRFSVHDGPGIRTAVFFKGCPLRCRWCHNPESQSFAAERMMGADGADAQAGQTYALEELIKELEKDRIFYEQSGGGVTLSGGEPMAQDADYLEALARALTRRGISLAVDTCGDAPYESFRRVLPYTEWFLYDLKLLDSELHRAYTGAGNERILENLKRLGAGGARIDLRLILLGGINDQPHQAKEMIEWLQANRVRVERVNLLPYHEYGRQKYKRLGREAPPDAFSPPDVAALARLKDIWTASGYPAIVGGAWEE